MRETTALGAAIAAGLAIGVWRNFAELRDINRAGGAVFEPQITQEESLAKFAEWEKAVQMSRGWVTTNKTSETFNGVSSPEVKVETNSAPVKAMENRDSPAPKPPLRQTASPLISDIVSEACINTTLRAKTQTARGDLGYATAKTPIISISNDLDDADEEDLFLELRKVEILQKLKRLRKHKLNYF